MKLFLSAFAGKRRTAPVPARSWMGAREAKRAAAAALSAARSWIGAASIGFALISCAHTAADKRADSQKAAGSRSAGSRAFRAAKASQAASGGASNGAPALSASAADKKFPFPGAGSRGGGTAHVTPALKLSAEPPATAPVAAAPSAAETSATAISAKTKEPLQRALAAAKEPEQAQRNPAFFSPSVLPFAKNRDMAQFYSQWASQFQEAVRHYRAAAKHYKKAAKHFEKMSEFTKKRKDQLFRKHFEGAAERLKAADGFLAKARLLRQKKP